MGSVLIWRTKAVPGFSLKHRELPMHLRFHLFLGAYARSFDNALEPLWSTEVENSVSH